MNKQEFFLKLEEHSKQYQWYIANEAIRGIGLDKSLMVCPITAVVYSELGIKEPMWNAVKAATEHLGLTHNDALDIQMGADFSFTEYRDILLSIIPYHVKNREEK